jgi:ubiquinone/menaquinone biosynthesis C-methylase UbiE
MDSRRAHRADILAHYERADERGRLASGVGLLERLRTMELLHRYLPGPPARVADVGGGAGVYALPLAVESYEVHLVDPVPLHASQAQKSSERQAEHPLVSVSIGDARDLAYDGGTFDAMLLLGPLYHLTMGHDRLAALREGSRVLRSGGLLFAAAISRFASTYDGLVRDFLNDDAFRELVKRDVRDGQHRNPHNLPHYFTTAFFHRPEELSQEVIEVGLSLEGVFAIEGPGSWLQDVERWLNNAARREVLLDAIRRVELEPSLLGASAHLLAVARRP